MDRRFPVTELVVDVPECLNAYDLHLQEFVEGMVDKLAANSHKNTPVLDDIPGIIAKLREEITEFEEQQRDDPHDQNNFRELHDIANFAFLAAVAIKVQGIIK